MMDVSVLIEPVSGHGYRATALMPTPVIVEGSTREEAVDRIRAVIDERLAHAELIQVRVSERESDNPWLELAGSWRNNPELEEVEENIQDYRRQVDMAAERP